MSKSKNIIITGVNGFVGDHVVDTFRQDGFDIIGVARDKDPNDRVKSKLAAYVSCDLLDQESVKHLDLTNVRAIIHLAGLSAVGKSFDQPRQYIADNTLMTYNLLDRAKSDEFSGRTVVVSTGALYKPEQQLPLREDSQTQANSPYAIGKLAAEHVADYFHARGLDTVTVRPFNHIGPGQGEGFILPDLYKQLTECGASNNIHVGNLTTRRGGR